MQTNYHIERGRLLLTQNRTAEAEKELRKAIAQEPENPIALALLAECYLESKRFAEGLEAAKQAVGLEPEIPFLYYILSRAFFFNKKPKEARQTIHSGLALDPNDSGFYLLLANVEFYEEHWEAALKATETGLELNPESVHLINMRAQALIKLNRREEASGTLDYALHKAPDNANAHANKGWVAIERDQYDEAVLHFKEALRLNPTSVYAKSGLKEAIKGKNLLYRYILKYFIWMSKMTERGRWGFIIGVYILYRLLLAVIENFPGLAVFFYPLVVIYILFAFSSWIALPVSNLFLRLHPLGKYALEKDETLGSNLVGGLAAGAIVCLAGFYFTGMVLLLYLGAYFGLLMLPVGGLFGGISPTGKARKTLSIYTIILAGIGLLAVFTPSLTWPVIAFLIGIFVYGWVANYLIGKDAREFS